MFFTRNTKIDIRVILFYCLYSFVNDLAIINLAPQKITGVRYVFILLSLFTIIEYCLFSVFIYLNLQKGAFKKIILYCTPPFILFSFLAFFKSTNTSIDSVSITVEYILIIIYCMFYFFKEINHPESLFIYSSYSFWVIVSILIYSTGTFFFFIYSDNLTDEQWAKWAIINYIFTIVKNALFGVAVILPKNDKSKSKFNEKPQLDHLFEKPFSNLL